MASHRIPGGGRSLAPGSPPGRFSHRSSWRASYAASARSAASPSAWSAPRGARARELRSRLTSPSRPRRSSSAAPAPAAASPSSASAATGSSLRAPRPRQRRAVLRPDRRLARDGLRRGAGDRAPQPLLRCYRVPAPAPRVHGRQDRALRAAHLPPGWVAAVLGRSGTLALLQPDVSGGAWVTIGEGAGHGGFRDVALWRGRLCALCDDGTVLAYRADLRARVAAVSCLNDGTMWRWEFRTYLVESEGELLLVRKLYGVMRVEVRRFRPEERKWEEVTELPGRAVFVGAVSSVAAALQGVRENCVYIARREVDTVFPHAAIGVYSMGDQETAVVAIPGGYSVDVEPVWIIPSVA